MPMPIRVKLFGDLRKKLQQKISGGAPLILQLNDTKVKTVADLLEVLGILGSEISHIFVNGKYSGFRKTVKESDTIALFPKNMGLLYKWYFDRDENG